MTTTLIPRMLTRILLCLLWLTTPFVSLLADVRVLSVGISDYPESSGWCRLNADNDIELIKSLFPQAVVLRNAEATRSRIDAHLKTLSRNVHPGDTVIVHFSGHGQQILTRRSADEVDGVDEALVPFDARKRKSASYNGENHLTDDVFGTAIDAIRRAVGPNGLVMAVLDACHSDSMDKDADDSKETYRGTDEIFGTETLSDSEVAKLKEAYHNREERTLTKSVGLSDVVYLSACQTDSRNYEVVIDGKGFGSLTYYFTKAFRKVGLSDIPDFLSAIYSGMDSDSSLCFHGQLPAVRNTLGWQPPEKNLPEGPKPTPDGPKEDTSEPLSPLLIGLLISLTLLIFVLGLWITRKNKR